MNENEGSQSPDGARVWNARSPEAATITRAAISPYVLDLALADDPERHQLVLTADEQTDLRDAVAELRAFVLALMIELPNTGGLSLLAAIAVLGEAGRR